MRASSVREKIAPIFQPFDLVIRIESLKEAQDIRFLFNVSPISDALKISDHETRQVRCAIDEQCGFTAASNGFEPRFTAVKRAFE